LRCAEWLIRRLELIHPIEKDLILECEVWIVVIDQIREQREKVGL
jgi:hypothetical protein